MTGSGEICGCGRINGNGDMLVCFNKSPEWKVVFSVTYPAKTNSEEVIT